MGSKGLDCGACEKYNKLPSFKGKSTTAGGDEVSDGQLELKCDFKLGGDGINLGDHLARFRAFPFDSTRVDASVHLLDKSARSGAAHGVRPLFNRPNDKLRVEKDGVFQHIDWQATRHSDDYGTLYLL